MKNILVGLAVALVAVTSPVGFGVSDDEVTARKNALDLAGAFSNDGFKIRDGSWIGQIAAGKSSVIQVNLYAGNEYWFTLGATPGARKLNVSVFDETGAPVEYEPYTENQTAAAGFAPEASGPYYIKVEQLEGEPASFCLLYSYK
jgi:hypothetical protein